MHLLERYATSCGVKIGKPYIYEIFFPLPFSKYITFQPYSKYDSKNYDYWEEVISLVHKHLQQQNIHIVQIGAQKDRPVSNCYNVCGQTKIGQAAHIIKNGLMHVGADSFGAHVASGFNKKILTLYSNNNIENVKPYWSDNKDVLLLRANSNKKPSYSAAEQNKDINNIKPEIIAQGILDLLDIKIKLNISTKYIGRDFQMKTLEIIPDPKLDLLSINIENPIIRMDYNFDETFLEKVLQLKKSTIIFTDRKIKEQLLKSYKNKINQIIYIINENNDPKFAEILKRNSINYVLLSFLKEDVLNQFRIKYLDYNLIVRKDHQTKPQGLADFKNLKYKSSRILVSSEGQFRSKYDWKNKNGDQVIDNEDFWKEVDNFYIFELT